MPRMEPATRRHFCHPYLDVTLSPACAPLALLLALTALATPSVRAQVGSTTDILIGVISGPDARPLAGATVDAMAIDGQITRHALTGTMGDTRFSFPLAAGNFA